VRAARRSSCAFSSFPRVSARRAAASFTSSSKSTWPRFTCCPSVAWTRSTKVSNCALMTLGAIASTLPLLLIEDTKFSRTGRTAEIFATGGRPLRATKAYAPRPARTRKIRIRLRSLRSILLACLLAPWLELHTVGTRQRFCCSRAATFLALSLACWAGVGGDSGINSNKRSDRFSRRFRRWQVQAVHEYTDAGLLLSDAFSGPQPRSPWFGNFLEDLT